MRRTRAVAVVLVMVGMVVPGSVMGAAHAAGSRHPGAKIRQHLVRRGGRALFTHSAKTQDFDQYLIGGGRLVPVTSSTGQQLYVGVFMDQYADAGFTETDLEVNVANQNEDDLWDLRVRDGGMIYDPLSGHGKVRVSSTDIGPYGSVHMTIAPAGKSTTTTCPSGGTRTVRPITMRGTLVFNTAEDVWGSVGDPVGEIVFNKKVFAELDHGHVGAGCGGFGRTAKCNGNYNAQVGTANGIVQAGTYRSHGELKGFLNYFGLGSQPLQDGANGDLTVFVDQDSPPPTLTRHGGRPTVALDAGSDGAITGSATWTAHGKRKTFHGECRKGATASWSATYAPGPDPLTVTLASGEVMTPVAGEKFSYIDVDPDRATSSGHPKA